MIFAKLDTRYMSDARFVEEAIGLQFVFKAQAHEAISTHYDKATQEIVTAISIFYIILN